MMSDQHTLLILRTIRENADDQGFAPISAVEPAIKPFGLDASHVAALFKRGLIESGNEVGRLRLTRAGLRRATA